MSNTNYQTFFDCGSSKIRAGAIDKDNHSNNFYCESNFFFDQLNIEEELQKIIYNLEKNGIETRPIISGNFAKQPACIKYGLSVNKKFPKTDLVYNNSFFIGLPTKKIGNIFLNKIIKAFEKSFK